MGMFDTLFDAKGHDWQTKAYDCMLDVYRIGDAMPSPSASNVSTYQVEILGDPIPSIFVGSFATVKDNRLESVDDPRDERLPRVDYGGAVWPNSEDI